MIALTLLFSLLAPPIDWANHGYPMFELKGGQAEMREYVEAGGLHDTHIWRLLDTHVIAADERALTVVAIRRDDHLAHGRSKGQIRLFLFDGAQLLADETLPTPTARFTLDGGRFYARWIEGTERVTRSWQITRAGFAERKDARLRPRRKR